MQSGGMSRRPDTPHGHRFPSEVISHAFWPKRGDAWHLDEVFLRLNAEQHRLWRAVGQHGGVLDIVVQDRRNAAARSLLSLAPRSRIP